MPFKLSRPAAGGGGWDKSMHLEHLHVFVAPTLESGVETAYGTSDAARCQYIACVDDLEHWSDQLVFGAALGPKLTGDPDAEIVVGRLGQGIAKAGRSAPWTLDDPTERDLEAANDFLEKYATRLPSGTIIVDEKALATDRAKRAKDDDF